jgi:hypothetical protein
LSSRLSQLVKTFRVLNDERSSTLRDTISQSHSLKLAAPQTVESPLG